MLDHWEIQQFYYNSDGFYGDPKINQPTSKKEHIPCLEAMVGAVYLAEGIEYCKDWFFRIVCQRLDYTYCHLSLKEQKEIESGKKKSESKSSKKRFLR